MHCVREIFSFYEHNVHKSPDLIEQSRQYCSISNVSNDRFGMSRLYCNSILDTNISVPVRPLVRWSHLG